MKDKYHLSVTEREIMEKLWAQDGPIRQTALLAMFNDEGKQWGRQTLNTLLIRLEQRGFVKREHRIVWAVYNREEFGAEITKETADIFFGGEPSKLFASFAKSKKISVQQAKELMAEIEDLLNSEEEA